MGEVSRPPSRAAVAEAAVALRRLLAAVEEGQLELSTPKDVALLRRLEGVLAGWETALGEAKEESKSGS